MAQQNTENLLRVRIVSPKKDIFEDVATSVSSTSSAGNFDILPQHANLVTLVRDKSIIIRPPKGPTQTFQFHIAIIYVVDNQVNIYTDIQIDMDEK